MSRLAAIKKRRSRPPQLLSTLANQIRVWSLIAVAAAALGWWGCASGPDVPIIDLSAEPAIDQSASESSVPSTGSRTAIRFAVAAVNTPEEAFGAYERLAGYLGTKLGQPVELVRGKTYGEINELLRSGAVDTALVCVLPYVEGHDAFGLEALVVPVIPNNITYRAYLITHKDSPIEGWEDLRGRTFAFTDPMSNTGRLVPIYMLGEMGETPDSYFSKYIFTYSHNNSIKAVAERLVDAASVDSVVYVYLLVNDPTYAARTKVVWESPAFGMEPIVVPPWLSAELKAQLVEALLRMDESKEGREVLTALNYERFVPADDSAYDSVREMRDRMRSAR